MGEKHIKLTHDYEYLPDGKRIHWFCGKRSPLGYWVDREGTKKHLQRGRGKEKKITHILCTVWDISEEYEHAIPKTLDILFFNNEWDEPNLITVRTGDATDPKTIVRALRDAGALVISKDGQGLAEYFRDCCYLRIEENNARGVQNEK